MDEKCDEIKKKFNSRKKITFKIISDICYRLGENNRFVNYSTRNATESLNEIKMKISC